MRRKLAAGRDSDRSDRRARPRKRDLSYRIEEKLGEGGFASVYRAHDTELSRTVALKILKRIDGQAPSLRREARAAAVLNHPNVCTIYGVDHELGVPTIVMEHLPGRSLADLLREGPPAREDACRIVAQVASAMAAAHDAGVVHGDLKPGNLRLSESGDVKVLDFGLAVSTQIPCEGDATLTFEEDRPRSIAGSPCFMSPEQAAAQRPTSRSDVFSLGLILYELLAGERCFEDRCVVDVLRWTRELDPERLAADLQEPFRELLIEISWRTIPKSAPSPWTRLDGGSAPTRSPPTRLPPPRATNPRCVCRVKRHPELCFTLVHGTFASRASCVRDEGEGPDHRSAGPVEA